MDITRRDLLRYSLIGATGVALGPLAGCGSDSSDKASSSSGGSSGEASTADLALWYWGGGLSDKVVADASTHFPNIKVTATQIGGNFKEKLLTTMTGGQGVPDITGIKGEDIASFLSSADQFVDLRELGADSLASKYLAWKWKQGSTVDGKLIGFPIDIGPTALYYRPDIYEQAGLPTDPAAVGTAFATWEAFFDAGVELQAKVPGTFMLTDAGGVFTLAIGQGAQRFVDPSNTFIGDGEHVRRAFELAAKTVELGIDGRLAGEDYNAALDSGTLPSIIGAAWLGLDIKSAAKASVGKWKVAPGPGGASNIGGSFLAIPKSSSDPKAAFEVITWLLSPENQARGFTDASLFPSTPEAYAMPALTAPDPFFGGQATIEVFGPAAKSIPEFYEGPYDAAIAAPYYNEVTNIESGKSLEDAWADAVSEGKKIAKKQGVKTS